MDQEFYTALSLLAIGMTTVFVVLFLVVITGNFMIWLVNKYFGDAGLTVPKELQDDKKIAAITAAVEIFTQGKGKVEKIEPKNN